MILPIVAYGDPVLKKKAEPIDKSYHDLDVLIANMWETMYQANGVGLAAPQIGKSLRLFVIDGSPFADEDPSLEGFKKVFINPEITERTGTEWLFNEGCLSFPELREDIYRKPDIMMSYLDENLIEHTEHFSGLAARIIQHEYDHVEGILMVDRISPLKKQLIKKKLSNISRGVTQPDYLMRFPLKKR